LAGARFRCEQCGSVDCRRSASSAAGLIGCRPRAQAPLNGTSGKNRSSRLKCQQFQSRPLPTPEGSRDGEIFQRSAKKGVKSAIAGARRARLKSGKGGKGGTVKSRKQAIAIGPLGSRKKGKKVPKRRPPG